MREGVKGREKRGDGMGEEKMTKELAELSETRQKFNIHTVTCVFIC